jgi:hypothetical protein
VLAGLLAGWVPISLALEASAALSRVVGYGWPAALLLLARVIVAGLAVVAGRALWTVEPHARRLAQAWLVLDAIVTGVTLATPYFPGNWLPGMRRWAFAGVTAFNGAWFAYLGVSRRVRACWP